MAANHRTAKEADYLLVSLYWWRDVFEFLWWLYEVGIDPRKQKPVIIIGGMAAQNPRPISGFFHFACIGDGEAMIGPLLTALEAGEDPHAIAGVWHPTGPVGPAVNPEIPADVYVESRKAKITRIEIARGCRSRCPYCQLSWTKPYREMPLDTIAGLLAASPTKTVSAFAPNRCAHSAIHEIDAEIARLGLHNMGSDTRLDQVKKFKRLDGVRFGVEGFAEKTRKKFRKVTSNRKLIDGLLYVGNDLENLRGKPMRSATMYMIGNLPGEGLDEIREFWGTLMEADRGLTRGKLTLFLSTSSFVPAPFTPLERKGCDPYTEFNQWMGDTRPHYENIVIAVRGNVAPAPARLAQLLTVRGDERVGKAMLWLATTGQKYLKGSGRDARRCGRIIEKAVNSTGFPAENLYRELPGDYRLPWWNTKRKKG